MSIFDNVDSALISSLLALGLEHSIIDQIRLTKKNVFMRMDQKLGNHILHFLLTVIDPAKSTNLFRDCWPILDRKQETQFRSIVQKEFKGLRQSDGLYPKVSEVVTISAVNTYHPKFKDTILILTCLAFHSAHIGIHKKVIACPRLRPDDAVNQSVYFNLKNAKLYHCHNYVKSSKARQMNLQSLQSKTKEMCDYYYNLERDIDLLKEECLLEAVNIKPSESPNSYKPEELTKSILKKNQEIKFLWDSMENFRKKEKMAWPMISALTDSSGGGITTLNGKSYSDPLSRTCWSRDKSKPLTVDGKLDLVSLFSHSSLAFKALIEKAKKEQRSNSKESCGPSKGVMQCLASVGQSLREIKNQLETALPPLRESVSSLRERIDSSSCHFDSFSSELTLCPPTPNYFSVLGKSLLSDNSKFELLDLNPGCNQMHTPTSSKGVKRWHTTQLSKFKNISEISQICGNKSIISPIQPTLNTPFKAQKGNSLNSSMKLFNKILECTNKYVGEHNSSSANCFSPSEHVSFSSQSPPSASSESTLVAIEDEPDKDLKNMVGKMALVTECPSKNKSPIVSRILTEISKSQEKKESKFISFVQRKREKMTQKKAPDKKTETIPQTTSPPLRSLSNLPKADDVNMEDFSAMLSSFESTIGCNFDFKLDNCPKDFVAETCEDEYFMSTKEFADHIEKPDTRMSLLPKSSIFDTLTEAVLGGEVDPSIIFDKDFDDEIRRESISKRESLMSFTDQVCFGSNLRQSTNWRLSEEIGLLQDDSGSFLLESSFDSE